MAWNWRTLDNGIVQVDKGQGFYTPSLIDADRSQVDRWAPLAWRAANKYGVPLAWILGVIRSESGGDPSAVSYANACGLMQVVPKWHNTTKAAMMDPHQAIYRGTSILRRLIDQGMDLPRVASSYNAGQAAVGKPHPSTKSPWGIREQEGYIMGVVAGQNWYRKRLEAGEINLRKGSAIGGSVVALVGVGACLYSAR